MRIAVAMLLGMSASAAPPVSAPPVSKAAPVIDTLHGVSIADPYRWLEDQNSPETRAWITRQNEYTQAYLKAVPGRAAMEKRLGELMRIDVAGVPTARQGRYFFTKRAAAQNQAVLFLRKGLTGVDEVLVDPNPLSPDQTTSVQLLRVSDDGKLLVYGLRQGGEDEMTVRVMNVDTRQDLPDQLPRARYHGIAMNKDQSGFYYARFTNEGARVYYHALGSAGERDKLVFGEGYGPMQLVSVDLSDDGKYLVCQVEHGVPAKKVEVFVQDLSAPGSALQPIVKDIEARFSAEIYQDKLYLQTNWQAPNERILVADLKRPGPAASWRVLVPESPAALEHFSLAGGKLFLGYLENATTRTKVLDLQGQPAGEVAYPALGTGSALFGRSDQDEAFYTFASFAQPTTIYRYQVATGQSSVWFRPAVPVNSEQVEVKQVWYASKDGTKVPMFVVHKKGLALNGQNPTLLTGYGGFNISMTPGFSATWAYWIEQGGVYALPSLRGGGEFGEKWHEAGTFERKQNVFDDFIGAAEWLVVNKYTSSPHLAISGGSNGGLLVGAAVTQRPNLFGAVLCAVPLLDMVRFQKFKVGHWWTAEYGSADNAQQFPYLYRYSPYHHVEDGVKYPAVMFLTGDADTRVDPLHARKMTARMQSATRSGKPVLLHYDTKAGHSGGLPVRKLIEDAADTLSFLTSQVGN